MSEPYGGLDLSNFDAVTAEERDAFHAFYETRFGHRHRGLEFLLENRADVLKRFRQYVRVGYDSPSAVDRPYCFGFLAYYALIGYDVGVRYQVRTRQLQGMSKSQCLDGIAIASLEIGPRGMETVAIALDNYQWFEPTESIAVPVGWDASLEALDSGLDYSSPNLSAAEFEKLQQWYLRWLGEIPPYVGFLGTHHPNVLKSYRNRFEHCIHELPKQAVPYTLLHFNVLRGCSGGIRENVLLAKGFGMTKEQTLRAIASGMEYGSVNNVNLVHDVAADVFDAWQ
jgi:hypothetical protein